MRDYKLEPLIKGFDGKLGILREFSAYSDDPDVRCYKDLRDSDLFFAVYSCESYEGSAIIVFGKRKWNQTTRKNEYTLYRVNGGHCSCYGLEGQWKPEPTIVEQLVKESPYSWNIEESDEFKAFKNWLIAHKDEFVSGD